jgi:WD40 repeat protein
MSNLISKHIYEIPKRIGVSPKTICIDKTNRYLFTNGPNFSIDVYSIMSLADPDGPRMDKIFNFEKCHKDEITKILVDGSNSWLFSCSKDRSVRIYDIRKINRKSIMNKLDIERKVVDHFRGLHEENITFMGICKRNKY